MKTRSMIALLAVALSAPSLLLAGSPGTYTSSGSAGSSLSNFYGGASIGQSYIDSCISTETAQGSTDCDRESEDNAWKVFGGYKVMPNLGFEGSYIDFGEISDKNNSSNREATGFNVSAIGFAPVAENLELFGKLGIARWEEQVYSPATPHNKVIIEDSGLTIGAGANFNVTPNFGIRGEFEHFDDFDRNLLTVGGTFRAY